LTAPDISAILMGIFPHAFEILKTKLDNEGSHNYIIQFEPKKFLITSEAQEMMNKLLYDIKRIEYNVDSQLIDVYVWQVIKEGEV